MGTRRACRDARGVLQRGLRRGGALLYCCHRFFGGGTVFLPVCAAGAPPPLLFACLPVRWPDTHHSSLAHRRVALARGAASAGRRVVAWVGRVTYCTIEPVDVMPLDAAAPAVGALSSLTLVSGVLGVEAIVLMLCVVRRCGWRCRVVFLVG